MSALLHELQKRVDAKLVKAVPDPSGSGLTIFDYTDHCVFERAWDAYTLQARGLVLDSDGKVVARPWPKFFNLGQTPDTQLAALPASVPELSRKYDGSLVVVFHHAHHWRATTRACWDNEQTRFADRWLAHSSGVAGMSPRFTYLFELVAPWNRIVVTYPREDMVLVGVMDTEFAVDGTYADVRREAIHRGFTPVEFETRPIDSVDLDDASVKNDEGFVARFANGMRVKLKYAEYRRLHRLLTGLSVKGIWECLAAGTEPDLSSVPDEFMEWYRTQRDAIQADFDALDRRVREAFDSVGTLATRKNYALAFTSGVNKDLAPALFNMLDGHPLPPFLWKRVRPSRHQTFQRDEE